LERYDTEYERYSQLYVNIMIEQENERKFLVKKLPDNIESYKHYKLEQYYLTQTEDEYSIRIRKYSNKEHPYYLEIKGQGMKSRTEITNPISEEEYNSLKTEHEIIKTRYEVPSKTTKGIVLQIDIYEGNLKGLIVAEAEVMGNNTKLLDDYIPDNFLGKEVTGVSEYTNHHLSFSQKIPSEPWYMKNIIKPLIDKDFNNTFKP